MLTLPSVRRWISVEGLLTVAFALGLLGAIACGGQGPAIDTPTDDGKEGDVAFTLTSTAFEDGGPIPVKYTCDGENLSPPLSWSDIPSRARSFALIVDDPDAPGGVFTHWVLFNLPADADGLPEGASSGGRLDNVAVEGRNDFGNLGYGGPCPPPGSPHRYRFILYALDAALDEPPGTPKDDVLSAMDGHVLVQAQLTGTYQR